MRAADCPAQSGIPREKIWVTSKLWPSEYGEGKTMEGIDKMLVCLDIGDIDRLLLHQQVGDYMGAWKDMEKAVAQGKVRAIGLSNFESDRLEAWYPLGHGDAGLLNEPLFTNLAQKYGKTNAQIILRWHIQEGTIIFPKSTNPQHIRDNFNIFDFELTGDEMAQIEALDCGKRYYTATLEEQERNFSTWGRRTDCGKQCGQFP